MELAITWLQYALIILIALSIYYVVLSILYYRKEISNESRKGKASLNKLSSSAEESTDPEESADAFFLNQINDNNYDYNQAENDVDDHEDFDPKAEQELMVDEAGNRTPAAQPVQTQQNTSHQKYIPPIAEADDPVQKIEQLSSSLSEAIAIAADKNYDKDEFTVCLKDLLQRYPFLKNSPQMGLINNLITSECEKYGCVQLSAEEQVMLWNE